MGLLVFFPHQEGYIYIYSVYINNYIIIYIYSGDLSGSSKISKIQARYGTRRAAPAVAATAKPTAKGVLRFGRQKACWNSMVLSFGHDLQVIIP